MTDNQARRVRGVIFDMDGVLCESEPLTIRTAIGVLRDLCGLEVKPADFAPFIGQGEAVYFSGPAGAYGAEIDVGEAKARFYATYPEVIRGKLRPLFGAPEFIDGCRRLGLKLAVATSAETAKLEANLGEIGLPRDRFDAVAVGEEVANMKPAPDSFLLAAERLELPPQDCLVVEDAVAGVRAAKAAGCRCLALTTSFSEGELLEAGADWVAPDLASVPEGALVAGSQ